MLMNPRNITRHNGFTLVEILVVMLILVAMASVTIETTSELAFQNRYEVTKDRYEKIKRAIIGRPDVLINGQPDISGFVADMGRLPNNIRELLDQNYCSVNRTVDETTSGTAEDDCNFITPASWVTQNNWNGPYLSITKAVTDAAAFPDGWGSESASVTDLNYGWEFCLGPLAAGWCYTGSPAIVLGEVIITSKGKDHAVGGSNYNADFPSTPIALDSAQWQVTIENTITVNITPPNNAYCNDSVCDNPSYGIAACTTTKKATWIVGNCTDAGGNIIGHSSGICTSPLVWIGLATPTCSDSYYATEAECTAPVGSLLTATCSDGAYPDKATCEAVPQKWSSTASEFNCQKGGGLWKSPSQEICVRINFGTDTAYSKTASVDPATINENGLMQSFTFSSFLKLSDDSTISLVPQGYFDIGIYEYDATATPKCTATAYPTDKSRKVYFIPNTSIAAINW